MEEIELKFAVDITDDSMTCNLGHMGDKLCLDGLIAKSKPGPVLNFTELNLLETPSFYTYHCCV